MKKKVLTIMGTRPEAIKLAPLINLLKERDELESVLCLTAQHREMLDQVLHLFELEPDYDLNIMAQNQSLTHITARALEGLEEVLLKEMPSLVLVQGDTTTTMAGAMASFYHKVPVGHVEAGLRSRDKYSPFPEEINRCINSVISELHFAPTDSSKQNLLGEGIPESKLFVTGNTVIDALNTTVQDYFRFSDPFLREFNFDDYKVLLVEAHRRESFGFPLDEICEALLQILNDFPQTFLLFPVHRNPEVRRAAYEYLGDHDRAKLLDPMDPLSFHNLMARSHIILTDSGGIQEEAPSLGKPVLVLRNVTERREAIEAGTAVLTGTSRERIYGEAARLLTDEAAYNEMARTGNPYGDGVASARILDIILNFLGYRTTLPGPFIPKKVENKIL